MAQTVQRPLVLQADQEIWEPIAASTTIRCGMICCYDSSGNIVEAADTNGLRFAGIARHYVDNSAGAAAAKDILLVNKGEVVVEGDATLAATGGQGTIAYASDGDTVSNSAGTNSVEIGIVVAFRNVNDPAARANAVRVRFGYGHGTPVGHA